MTTSISLQPYPREKLLSFINHLVAILPGFGIAEVDALFGYGWGNDFHNWETRTIPVASLQEEINEAEQRRFGSIGQDDLYVWIRSHDLEIHLCHEEDIHITFSNKTDLIDAAIRYLVASFQNVAVENRHRTSGVYIYGHPAFLFEKVIANNTDRELTIKLDPWRKTFECPPRAKMTVVGYSSEPGFLNIERLGDHILVKGWPSCNIRLFRDHEVIFDTKDDQVTSQISIT